jgi:hypothetical protein
MPLYPFYFEAKDKKNDVVDLTDYEQEKRLQDYEAINNHKEYHRSFHEQWAKAGALYNVLQEGTSDDRISNFYIGLARMIIDTGVGMMTEGQPDYDYDPIGPADVKKMILWKSFVKKIESDCNAKSHYEKWITDMHIFGPSALEVYTQLPMRLKRYEHEDGSIEEKLTRDFRRSKVGIRHRSIWYTYRNPNVTEYDDVPSGGYTEYLTHSQFVQSYANVFFPDGKPKYKNIDKVGKGSHYKVEVFFDEIQDAFRIYAIAYGTKPDGKVEPCHEDELGLPIFDKPLCIYRMEKKLEDGRKVTISNGANVPGMVPLCFGNFNDQLDKDYKTHALYGMGIPQLIDGPEAIMQALFNMTVDNMRLKNTVVVGYEGTDGKSAADFDNLSHYSGTFVDGRINPQSLGIADMQSNSVMWEWLNNICIWVTGINFQQLGGDSSKTAFEFSQRIRANNQRAEKRIRSLENGPLKRAGLLLLSNALSECTVEEWDKLSEGQVEEIAAKIENNEVTAEDYQMENSKPVAKKMQMMIPVQGRKFREDFKGKHKTRKLDYNSTENTLIEDPELPGEVSYVPAESKYLLPTGDIESIMQFTVRVDGKRMLGDQRAQDMDTMQKLGDYFTNRFMAFANMPDQLPNVDMKKLDQEMLRFAQVEEDKVMQEGDNQSPLMEAADQALETLMNSSPTTNVQPLPTAPAGTPPTASQAGRPPAPPEQAGGPSTALAATASGAL